ncbi:MAG: tetratricopeptide repeat protein [Gammaproteobacteria bacterium]
MSKTLIQSIVTGTLGPAVLLLVAIASGCASLPSVQQPKQVVTAKAESETTPPAPTESFTASLLYQLLLGEIAGQRSDMDTALASYLDAAGSTRDPRVAERALRIAAYAKQQEGALLAARRWVALEGDNLEALQTLAILELRENHPDNALTYLERIIEVGGGSGKSYDRVVGALTRLPDQQLALGVMTQLVENHDGEAEAHFARSRYAATTGQLDQALPSIDRALMLRGYWTRAEIVRAEILLKQNKVTLARNSLKVAVNRHRRDVDLRLAYARVLVTSGDLKEANRQFKKLVRIQPDNLEVVFSLALLALESERFDEAKKYLGRLQNTGHRQQEVFYYLGRIAEQQDRTQEALEWFSKVTQGSQWLDAKIRGSRIQARSGDVEGVRAGLHILRSEHPQFAVRLALAEGAILVDQRRYQDAFELYSQLIDQRPNNTELRYARALVAEKLDQLQIAEDDLLNVLAREPNNGAALNALGYTLADRTDRLLEAEGYIVKALDLLPDDPAVIDSMGWLQYRLGNLQAAVTHLRRALRLSRDGEIAAHLGEVLWQMGDQNQARKVWEEARSEDPDNPVLQDVMQRFLP